jgi:hypothetical protein
MKTTFAYIANQILSLIAIILILVVAKQDVDTQFYIRCYIMFVIIANMVLFSILRWGGEA